MVFLRASFSSLSALEALAVGLFLSADSGSLHAGQRLAKPGLPGRSSNSSEQTAQILMGKAIDIHDNADEFFRVSRGGVVRMDVEWGRRIKKRIPKCYLLKVRG
jgi:hypothetical protein